MHRCQAVSLAVIAAMLSGSIAGPVGATPHIQHVDEGQGYCRTPAALPSLGAEVQQQQPRTNRRGGYIDRRGVEGPVPMAVPAPPPPPPPPPPPMASPARGDTAESASADIVMTGTTVRAAPVPGAAEPPAAASGRVASPTSIIPPRPRPQLQPQAGLLTAGEHDDLLNPQLYARYVEQSNLGQRIRDLPRVDTDRVLTVRVTDNRGRPVPFADIRVTCSDGNAITLKTQADGNVALFPDLDRLSPMVRIGASLNGRSMGRALSVEVQNRAGGQQVNFQSPTAAITAQRLDLALVIDTTGSMGDEITYLQRELASIVNAIRRSHPGLDLKVGFVFYRDIGDDYVTRTVNFDGNISRVQASLAQERAFGGGDYPEAMDQALIRAAGLGWRPDAVKSLLLVADAPPHDDLYGRTWNAAEHLRAQRVHITPVAASGVADEAEYAMRAMAALTQSRYLFLTDDSGIGNPHAPPAIDCYYVSRLDALLRRVIDSQLSGRRIAPADNEVIREVGRQDNGRCILPPDWQQPK
ncbi:VWA domain-containing protein [Sphingomonas lacunae]|uniref:VWA domain-containing protein n=1 Tax=Sphingomonas lacunae TaxID=2698828 RepID=A0A6M4APS1_9SPHN|nr:vWA domain-containing protein [Sphingomonas lacunae]QJQ31038.1 VWA domain-containing protein [Sphingomonas lacunae]